MFAEKMRMTVCTREKLENNQVWLYVIVLVIAAGFGLIVPDFAGQLDVTISASHRYFNV